MAQLKEVARLTSALQGSIKQDPAGHGADFEQQVPALPAGLPRTPLAGVCTEVPRAAQLRHYQASLALHKLQPGSQSREFGELVQFVAQVWVCIKSAALPLARRGTPSAGSPGSWCGQVAHCYPAQTAGFAGEVMGLLAGSFGQLAPPLRLTLVKALVLLHNRGRLASLQAVPFFLKLLRHHDKAVRRLLFQHILAGAAPRLLQRQAQCRAAASPGSSAASHPAALLHESSRHRAGGCTATPAIMGLASWMAGPWQQRQPAPSGRADWAWLDPQTSRAPTARRATTS